MSGRPRVLVADDHRAMLDSLVRLLSGEFEVVAAVDRRTLGGHDGRPARIRTCSFSTSRCPD